ncbi:hypothetical protein PFISCL1PPCAC_9295, partial [Pristionchus fissidentatus]
TNKFEMLLIKCIAFLALVSSASALHCYVGDVPWGVPQPTYLISDPAAPLPTLTECPATATCCSFAGSLNGNTYECKSNCSEFNGQSEVDIPFPTDGGVTYCLKAEGACKY